MISDVDIYRIARQLIDEHGAEAAKLNAAQLAAERLAKDDLNGWRKWRRVLTAIEELSINHHRQR